MYRMGCAVALVCVLTACGNPPIEHSPAPAPQGPATTTGYVPAGVPVEGIRPSTAGLPAAAEPLKADIPARAPAGRQVQVGAAPEGVVVDPVTRIVAVATRSPNELVLLSAGTGEIISRTPLPGSVRHLQLAKPGGPVLVPVESANALIRVDLPTGHARPQIITGTVPHDATQAQDGTEFVANELGGTVTALRGDTIVKVFSDTVQPAGLTPVGDRVGLLDVRTNNLTIYDAVNLTIVGSVPAGDGPTHLVSDKHGRLIAADTRGDTVRVFDTEPRQLAEIPQPGGPYGITYDATRDRLWVASSGTNEVVGYDMSEETPREVMRLPTVQNPYTLGVDPNTGQLFIAGVTTGVVQIVDPG